MAVSRIRSAPQWIALRAHLASWRILLAVLGFDARVRRFRPQVRFDAGAPVLVLSPHPDDAVLNCWSVLTSGRKLRIVNVFAGAPAPGFVSKVDRLCGAEESAAHVRARRAEDEEVLTSLGHRPAHLSFLDIQYGPRWTSMRALDRAVAGVAPAASAVYAPAGLGWAHADHLLVCAYGRRLARAGLPVWLYADVPYATQLGWPAWVTGGQGERRDAADALWRPALRGTRPAKDVEVVALDDESARRKLEAMRAYRTQFDMLDVDGHLSDPAIHRHEVFWPLGPADT